MANQEQKIAMYTQIINEAEAVRAKMEDELIEERLNELDKMTNTNKITITPAIAPTIADKNEVELPNNTHTTIIIADDFDEMYNYYLAKLVPAKEPPIKKQMPINPMMPPTITRVPIYNLPETKKKSVEPAKIIAEIPEINEIKELKEIKEKVNIPEQTKNLDDFKDDFTDLDNNLDNNSTEESTKESTNIYLTVQ